MRRSSRWRWLVPLAWMAFIFWLSSQPTLPSAPEPWLDKVVKKMGHFFLYAVLCLSWMWALRSEGRSRRWVIQVAVVVTVLYGISDEFHQFFTPGRSPRLFDVFIDTMGALAAARFEARQGLWTNSPAVRP